MGFGTCCGETSRTALAVRSGNPASTVSSRVNRSLSGVADATGVWTGAGFGVGNGGGFGAGGFAGGFVVGAGSTSFINSTFLAYSWTRNAGNLGGVKLPAFPVVGRVQGNGHLPCAWFQYIKQAFDCRHIGKAINKHVDKLIKQFVDMSLVI